MSCQPCGCDPEIQWMCQKHYDENLLLRTLPDSTGFSEIAPELFTIKDSGVRYTFDSGSLRDTTDDKINWANVANGPMLERWAVHLTNGAKKYPDTAPGVPNWTLINTEAERIRYRESAFRHFMQWYRGDSDEDHAAAVFFNINGVEYVKGRLA